MAEVKFNGIYATVDDGSNRVCTVLFLQADRSGALKLRAFGLRQKMVLGPRSISKFFLRATRSLLSPLIM